MKIGNLAVHAHLLDQYHGMDEALSDTDSLTEKHATARY